MFLHFKLDCAKTETIIIAGLLLKIRSVWKWLLNATHRVQSTTVQPRKAGAKDRITWNG